MKKRLAILAAAVLAVTALPAFMGGTERVDAQCRAFFGSRNNGVCLDGPGGDTGNAGAPPVGIGPTDNGGPGISTGPLFPGQTINVPLAP